MTSGKKNELLSVCVCIDVCMHVHTYINTYVCEHLYTQNYICNPSSTFNMTVFLLT